MSRFKGTLNADGTIRGTKVLTYRDGNNRVNRRDKGPKNRARNQRIGNSFAQLQRTYPDANRKSLFDLACGAA